MSFLEDFSGEATTLALFLAAAIAIISLANWWNKRNQVPKVQLINPSPTLPLTGIHMGIEEFTTLQRRLRDEARADLSAAHGEERKRLEEKIDALNARLADPDRALAEQQAIRISLEDRLTRQGNNHPDHATRLNNLAMVLQAQGRYRQAEALYNEALAIGRATIGINHPGYAMRLNNLAMVVQAQGRYPQAEALYHEALTIGRATIGTNHPDHATRLNNLAAVVQAQGRYPQARGHYAQSLAIQRDRLGDGHPNTKAGAGNYLDLLQEHFPGDPEIPALAALAAP